MRLMYRNVGSLLLDRRRGVSLGRQRRVWKIWGERRMGIGKRCGIGDNMAGPVWRGGTFIRKGRGMQATR